MFDSQLSMKVVLLLVAAFALLSWKLFLIANHARVNRPVRDWLSHGRQRELLATEERQRWMF